MRAGWRRRWRRTARVRWRTRRARTRTNQAAQQAALGAALTYAAQLVERWTSKTATITVDNATTLKNVSEARVEDEAASDGRPVAQTAVQAAVDRLGVPPARQGSSGSKRRQREDEPSRKKTEPQHAALARKNKSKLDELSRRFNFRISVRAPPGATPMVHHGPASAGNAGCSPAGPPRPRYFGER